MKKLLLLSAILTVTFGSARAQLTSTVTSQKHDPAFSMGRDFWFAFPSNDWGTNEGGKYMRIYITSTKNTTAYVTSEGQTTAVPVGAYKVGSFRVPEFWEMESSGIVENKGIHVYDTNADLSVYFISDDAYTSDGSYVIPTIGWGTDYVVAAYGSLIEGSGQQYDEPSECVIVANEDHTVVELTPSCDCRKCPSGNDMGDANSTIVVFPAGHKFSDTLNRGQSLQLMPVKATGLNGFDLTGTIIHSNNPIGMIGGSMQPDIPNGVPYADFACEMIPPVRTWGETYYATSFYQPANSTDDSALYLFIASKAGQIIHRQTCTDTPIVECTIPNQYGIFWDELPLRQKFWSSAPFLVVSYINSANYPTGNTNGKGDPAETNINPREGFTKTVIFQTPQAIGNIIPYYNYANITVNVKDAQKTLFDGKGVSGIPAQCLDSNWEIFTVPNIASGAHTVTGDDSGVGVYIYGYGYDESYAWSSPGLVSTFQSPDSTPPVATVFANCASGSVVISDTGTLASKLDEVRLDTAFNMTYKPDTSWSDGSERASTSYNFFVGDPTKPAYLQVSAFDYAGNRTTITTAYSPFGVVIQPPLQNLELWVSGNPPNIAYDTIVNSGQEPLILTGLHLLYGNRGFSIFDSIGGPLDLSPLPPGGRRLIQIQFEGLKAPTAVDSIIVGGDCQSVGSGAVIGRLGPDFIAFGGSFDTCLVGTYKTLELVGVRDTSSIYYVTIDSIWSDNPVFFYNSSLPVVSPLQTQLFPVTFAPTAPIPYNGNLFIRVTGEEVVSVPLSGIGYTASADVFVATNPTSQASVIAMDDGRSLEIILPGEMAVPANFELVNVLGQNVLRAALTGENPTIDASGLPRGVYFYRLTVGSGSQSGKVMLGE